MTALPARPLTDAVRQVRTLHATLVVHDGLTREERVQLAAWLLQGTGHGIAGDHDPARGPQPAAPAGIPRLAREAP